MRCALCNGEQMQDMPKLDKFVGVSGDHRLYRCCQCRLIQRFYLPEDETIPVDGDFQFGEYTSGGNCANTKMARRLEVFNQLITSEPRTMLDVGCGTGAFLDLANNNGWEAWGTEIEPGRKSNDKIVNIDIISESSDLLKENSFDIVHSSHVLEHVADPGMFIEKCVSFIKPGGYLYIELPNEFSSLTTQIKILLGIKYKSATAYYQHRLFFNKAALGYLFGLDKCLENVHISTPFSYYGLPLWKKMLDYCQSAIGKGAVFTVSARKK